MRLPAVVSKSLLVAALAAAIGGCGANDADAVRAKVRQFARAVGTHDYATICNQVLAPVLLADLAKGGIGCQQAMKIALAQVNQPHLVLGPVTVSGSTATALTISQAQGQKTLLTSLHLVQTQNGWRISSLGAPLGS
jgi:type IV pilus biogenesis protein CpaD/CtpE